MTLLGYGRVSTDGQSLTAQVAEGGGLHRDLPRRTGRCDWCVQTWPMEKSQFFLG
jgi:hypothetical protein